MTTVQIGFTASTQHFSGTDRYFLSLLRELPALGVGVRGMVLGQPERLEDPLPFVQSFALEGASRSQRWTGARRTIRRLLPGSDVVVSHAPVHAFYTLDILGRRPLIVHFHGPWALEGRDSGLGRATVLVRQIQERLVYARAKRFIVLSRAFGDVLVESYGVPRAKIRVIPGGVDLQRFEVDAERDDVRRRHALPTDRPILIATRRLEPTKGVGALIDAIPEIRRAVPNILCLITNTGTLRSQLEARVQKLGLSDNVRFLGLVGNELPELYRASDISIVPSLAWEGFGLSVVESLAAGTPALVTPVGGLPEVVANLDPRLILEGSSAGEIASGTIAALLDPKALPTPSACRAYARRFSWDTIAQQVRDVYRGAA